MVAAYEWYCLACNAYNRVGNHDGTVTCIMCGATYEVADTIDPAAW
jgi:transcription elongation factor Elf1